MANVETDRKMYFTVTDIKTGSVVDTLYFPYVPPFHFGKSYNIKTYDSVNGKQFSSYAGYDLEGFGFSIEFPTTDRSYSDAVDGMVFYKKIDEYIKKQHKLTLTLTNPSLSIDCYVEKMHPKVEDKTFDLIIDFELIERNDPKFLSWNPEKNNVNSNKVLTSAGKDTEMNVVTDRIPIREEASVLSKKLIELNKGTRVEYISEKDGWIKVKYKDITGYCTSAGLEFIKNFNIKTMEVQENTKLKEKPDILSKTLKDLPKGTIVEFVEEQNGWFKVKIDKVTGFVSGHHVRVIRNFGKKETGTDSKKRYHTVKKNDNLYDIAEKYYKKGSEYPKIKNHPENIANYPKLKNSNVIYVGWKLLIP